jgi:homoserine kinase
VTCGQHKAVAIKPAWLPRVVTQGDTEEHGTDFCTAKREPKMTRLAGGNGIYRQTPRIPRGQRKYLVRKIHERLLYAARKPLLQANSPETCNPANCIFAAFPPKCRTMNDQVTVRVPATSANLGPGFDCLGVALECYNHVVVRRGEKLPPDAMVDAAAREFFSAASTPAFDFSWKIAGDIPRSRGLGSSVVVRLGILHALNALSARPLTTDTLYKICARLEGHPDNAAPAAFGGFAAARQDGLFFRCDISPCLHFVLLVPDNEIDTDTSRFQLPETIAHADAAKNASHAALITAAFATRQYELLRGSMRDWLHEPYRAKAIPHLRPAVEAGVAAGALDGYLSGSGSAVACLTLQEPQRVADAMQSILPSARTLILRADNTGIAVIA